MTGSREAVASVAGAPDYNAGGSSLNDSLKFDLADTLHSYFGVSSDTNPYINIDLNSKFFDIQDLILSQKNRNSPVFLSINVRSLHSKIDVIKEIIFNLKNNNISIISIAIQEVWKIVHEDSLQIQDFTLFLFY